MHMVVFAWISSLLDFGFSTEFGDLIWSGSRILISKCYYEFVAAQAMPYEC